VILEEAYKLHRFVKQGILKLDALVRYYFESIKTISYLFKKKVIFGCDLLLQFGISSL
jgi:hypothetical protein